MTEAKVDVLFTPSGRRGEVHAGSTVLDAARSLGVDIDSVCGGRGICGRCQVTVGSAVGRPAHAGQLSDRGALETEYRGRRPLDGDHRLSCSARLLDDAVIDVPPESQVHRQVVRKRAEVINIPVDPVVRLYYIEVERPDMHRQTSDLGRVFEALDDQWGIVGLEADHQVLTRLQDALRAEGWKITVAVHDDSVITDVWPGFHDVAVGVAFDVGSTTIAGHLCDLFTGEVLASSGVMNPQIRFGEDLMSRVSYVMMNEGGERELTAVVQSALNDLVGELVAEVGLERNDVLEVALVGNPIMHHLFLGIDPRQLGVAPFALAVDGAIRTGVAAVGITANPGARIYVLPCVAGHVGADAAGAVLSEGPHRGDDIQLLVDVGTNAEIVLGSAGRLLAASSPTGPAFEGAEISSGQRAAPGAIERVRIDRQTLEPRFKIIGVEQWSDEDGFDDAASETGVTGICGSGIIEAVAELALSGVISADGRIVNADRSERITIEERTGEYLIYEGPSRITVKQSDVRAIQLAKSALYAGIRLLMDRLGVDHVDEIRLAGAFGSHIDTMYAMVLGMIPDCDLDRVSAAGNAAGTGSIMALLSGTARTEIEELVTRIEKIETAVEPSFQQHFVEAMAIPHATAEFKNLASRIDLSGIPGDDVDTARKNRRRRPETGSVQEQENVDG